VCIAPITGNHTAGGKGQYLASVDVSGLAIREADKLRQIPVMVEPHIQHYGAVGMAEILPGKQAQA